jgi:Protein of unknown function (DUF732)
MRVLPFLASAVAVVGLAVPAHADSDDDAFLAALNKAGISYKSPDRAIAAAQKVCDLANGGTSQLDIIRDVHEFNPSFSASAAAKFVQAAATAYCPDRLSVDSGGTNPNTS